MLNLDLGSALELEGRSCILTRQGAAGHAVYGPYLHLAPGNYAVEFNVAPDGIPREHSDDVCAEVDVVTDYGQTRLAQASITLARLRQGPVRIHLAFTTTSPHYLEFRVFTTGRLPLLIDGYCRCLPVSHPDTSLRELFARSAFPDPAGQPVPDFFANHATELRRMFENGATIAIRDGRTLVTIDGVTFNARIPDDLRFVGEIFYRSAYNVSAGSPCCVIDIGMNIGLVALTFAVKDFVREVHSFEPFKGTYQRARDNLALNPAINGKMTAYAFGLAGENTTAEVFIQDPSDSGAFSIRGSDSGTSEHIEVRNAAEVLGPIIAAARAKNLKVICKVDCEGSEFPIFRSLEQAGLLPEIAAFMVEWHANVEGNNQNNLLAPLLAHGFIAFDVSPKTGNGFFYAVRSPA